MATTRRIIKSEFIPLEARRLVPDSRLAFDVYADDSGTTAQLFSKGSVFSHEAMKLLIGTGIETVYVRSHENSELEAYLLRNSPVSARKSFYNNPLDFRNATFFKEKYYQIDRSTLKLGAKIAFNLYLVQGIDYLPITKVSEGETAVIDAALLRDERDMVIRKADIPLYREYLSRVDAYSASSQSTLLRETGKIAIKELLENPNNMEKVKEVTGNVENMIGRIFDNSDVLNAMLSMRNSAYYVYSHSINVTVLSLALGATSGMTKDTLLNLGTAAIFHDVGMSVISPEITNKQGQLTYREFAILKMHVTEGEKILQRNETIPEESIEAVVQHHEKLSGKGYPYKLKGDSIKLFGRIIGIADCFDALITTCPYRPAFSPFDALSIMAKDTGYDPDLLKYFIRMLGKRRKTDAL